MNTFMRETREKQVRRCGGVGEVEVKWRDGGKVEVRWRKIQGGGSRNEKGK